MSGRKQLLSLLKAADQRVPPGTVWTHNRTGKDYLTLAVRAMDEKTCQVLVLYTAYKEHDMIWARTVGDFVRSFEQKQ